MDFFADQEVFERFPGMRLAVAVAYGIDNSVERPEIDVEWRTTWEAATLEASRYPNPQSHPHIVPWRERFRAMGVSVKEFRSSAEALFRRAARGGEPFQINPLVDFYNSISLRHVAPAGAFDLAELVDNFELRLTGAGDTFVALESEDDLELELPPGEVAYAAGSTILTRHFVWRQAKAGLITPNSRNVFLVSEVLSELGVEEAQAIRAEFQDGLARYFNIPSQAWIVDSENPGIFWEAP